MNEAAKLGNDPAVLEAEVETAIALCDGDMRAALKATLVANAFLDAELARVLEMVSAGYGRGRVRKVPRKQGSCRAPTTRT